MYVGACDQQARGQGGVEQAAEADLHQREDQEGGDRVPALLQRGAGRAGGAERVQQAKVGGDGRPGWEESRGGAQVYKGRN